jgi:Ca2+-binding RTX toxin-like protein
MGSLPPRARLFAAAATVMVSVAVPAVSGAATNTATSGTQSTAAGPVSRSMAQATVQGTNGDDTIITKRRAQKVLALAGNDYVRLGSSNDSAYGADGNDWLHGNDGRDAVYGGAGNDHPQGGTGDDRVYGGPGDDELDGDGGNDMIRAGGGNDGVTGDEGNDLIYPGPGVDIVYGEQGYNHIIAKDDGVADRLYCSMINVGQAPGLLTYIGHRDQLDVVVNCVVEVKK